MSGLNLHRRHVEPRLREALKHSPAVLIQGPRQCGKTTLAQLVGGDAGYSYISFDDQGNLERARIDPVGFAKGLPRRAALDEVQKVPELIPALKLVIDSSNENGRFLLTGSANLLRLPQVTESLAGRMDLIDLHPLSQCELADAEPSFLDALFGSGFSMGGSPPPANDYTRRMVGGGYPRALAQAADAGAAGNWHRSYITGLVQRDARELSNIRSAQVLRPLLRFVAGYTAQLAYTAKLARALGVANRTVDDYLYLLENMYLLERLPSFTGDFAKREIVGKPKFHLRDSGIACALLNLDAPALDADPVRRGHLLETFVLQELRRQASGSERPYRFSHYRTKRGVEVDIVVEGHSGDALAGVEVKASATLRQEHFKGLRKLRDKLGDSFAGGVVLHEGEHCLPYGDRLYGVPLRRLWDAAATG